MKHFAISPLLSSAAIVVASLLLGCAASDSTGATGGDGGDGGFGTSTSSTTSTGAFGGMGSGGEGGFGGEGGEGGEGGADICAMGCPANTWDLDDNPLTGECGCEYSCVKISEDDPIDPNFTDDNCDGSDGVVEACVYVSAIIGDPNGAGTRVDPVQTIAQGIAVAQTHSVPSVCLSGEVYDEAVTLTSGISVYGGFDANDPDFAFRRSASVTTTVNATGTVFLAPQIDAETHVEGLTINAYTPLTAGASTYGVRLVAGLGELFVRYNVINAQAGADGANGTNGSPHANATAANGNPGANGCQGTNCGGGGPQPSCIEFGGKGGNGGYNNSNGQAGSNGSGGALGGSAGTATQECYSQSSSGGPGSHVTVVGAGGNSGSAGASAGTVGGGVYVPANGAAGTAGSNGKGGGGGGGGGGGSCTIPIWPYTCSCNQDTGGGGGSGGCGGLGGALGTGGQGGGGSFAVFAASGNITVTHNEMVTFGGGKGGNGGNGAAGQFGGQGGTGGSSNDDSGGGGVGGNGSKGGAGGPGGGGGGGPSACLARGFGVSFTYTMNSLCQVGAGGLGGSGASNPDGGTSSAGTTGVAVANLQIN
jgi:hypothetical protein